MIPRNFIIEWSSIVSWKQIEQIEQDLIISAALLKIYQHPHLREKVAFRGGTALNKLYFSPPSRYSEDIDLVQVISEPIGQTITMIREVMDPWLGLPKRSASKGLVTLVYRMVSDNGFKMRLKIEINTREHFAVLGYKEQSFSMSSGFFSGESMIKTYAIEELLGTKLRALYQRRKGRDLYDLYVAILKIPNLDIEAIVRCFKEYMDWSNQKISKKEFHLCIQAKLNDKEFREDILVLLPLEERHFDAEKAYGLIIKEIIARL